MRRSLSLAQVCAISFTVGAVFGWLASLGQVQIERTPIPEVFRRAFSEA